MEPWAPSPIIRGGAVRGNEKKGKKKKKRKKGEKGGNVTRYWGVWFFYALGK